MSSGKYGKDLKNKAAQLELLIIAMVGATLGSLQIINYVFLNTDAHKSLMQPLFDWLFSIAIITFLVHFSFREIRKVQEELIEKSDQATKAQTRLQHIIDNTQETIFVIDQQGKFKFASRSIEELSGYTVAEVANMRIGDLLPYEYRMLVERELNDYKNLGGRHIFVEFRRKDGVAIRVELCFIKIETEERGQVIQCLAREFCGSGETGDRGTESKLYTDPLASFKRVTDGKLDSNALELGCILHRVMLSHDPVTALHQMRLAVLVGRVAEELGLENVRVEWLKLAALLHDVGKLAVPYRILNKTGKLSGNELALVRLHAKRGIELLGRANLPSAVNDVILHHHERLDGSGYPHGLKAGSLNMETRILSVCDVADSMISHRPYRQALPVEEVTGALAWGKGTKYDADAVECVSYLLGRNLNDACLPSLKRY